MLEGIGVTKVLTSPDGAKAYDFWKLHGREINFIICDWNMPIMSGLEFLRMIRKENWRIPFLMITGRATEDAVAEARDASVSGYIAKPFSPDELEIKLVKLAKQALQA